RGDVFVAPANGAARNVTQGEHEFFGRPFLSPVWDRTGRALYLVASSGLWRVSLGAAGDRDELSRVITFPEAEVSWVLPALVADPHETPPGGRSLIVLTRSTATLAVGLYEVNLERGTDAPWHHGSQDVEGAWLKPQIVGSPTRGRVVFVAQDLQH